MGKAVSRAIDDKGSFLCDKYYYSLNDTMNHIMNDEYQLNVLNDNSIWDCYKS